ncbi:hypothetical protein QBC32DRAFT_338408 [Pseudoneurospora amorphoporcata]|uniref:RNase MRP protein 1 RNA binding domain-containing protein n=1 Tax=Pseudoneurospora amorphoporcata TaxID=241081 RepID=A0AAN6P140_9PEZI|nr:hypothetical protein QBC32DRAFT_338408 [Pseudoneurospora amorphoporcata]
MNCNSGSKLKSKPSKPKTKPTNNSKPTTTTTSNTTQPPVQDSQPETTSSSVSDPKFPSSLLPTLTPALDILSRFHHRNKNQHHLSKWWAEADMLRRHLRKLIEAANEWCNKQPERETKKRKEEVRKRKKKENMERLERVEGEEGKAEEEKGEGDDKEEEKEAREVRLRAGYLRGKLGPRAYLAFSQLSADRQFAHLGLMLLGILAQVDKALSAFVPVSIDDVDAGVDEAAEDRATAKDHPADDAPTRRHNDIGVAVSREELLAMLSTSGTGTPVSRLAENILARRDARDQPLPTTETEVGEPAAAPAGETRREQNKSEKKRPRAGEDEDESEPTPPVPEKKKKRKTGDGDGDDIDDIFASFDKSSKKKKASRWKTTAIATATEITTSTTATTTSIAKATTTKVKTTTTESSAPPAPPFSEAGAPKDDFDNIFASLEKPKKKKTTTKARKMDDLDDIFASFDKPKTKKKKKTGAGAGADEFDDIFGGL